ncbi:MAG: AmmeMemoRadiSam system protein B, partial [Anaerolineae bacterium]|nr:AmmeMemoRadiSam system protein B [Anaerolineae bacterium]
MPNRYPIVAGMFYPADRLSCLREVEDCLREAGTPRVQGTIYGGIVPHAGWTFSGPTAARVFAALRAQNATPETIILFGAVHSWGVHQPSMYGSGQWITPLGPLSIDEELAQALLEAQVPHLINSPRAHAEEHSLEVQLPFIKYLFPDVTILPIAVPPFQGADELGREIARVVRALGRQAPAIGSSDLTHYGPRYGITPAGLGEPALQWAKENDRRILDLMVELRAAEIVPEASTRHNACGAGAIAAAIGYAKELGARQGVLLHYTTSYDVMPTG